MMITKRPWRLALVAAATAVALLGAACGSEDGEDASAGTPAVSVLRGEGAVPSLEIDATGLQANAEYVARLHAGTCEAEGASGGTLGTLTADADGTASLSTSTVLVGAAGAPADLTAEVLEGDHVVRLLPVAGGDAICVPVP
ncbi:MAG: hypothetical protein AMXMBFR23_06990 [Chloroflexota bacterium]